ncbi:MAG: AsmA family protein [Granulosicoccaceae bacterium]|jgi:AsmA protein
MKKLIRTLVIVIGLLVTLFVAAAVALLVFFDPNDFKDQLETEVHTATGRSLQIEGDLSLSLFPWLGVETGALTLGNAQGFEKRDFAHVDAAHVRVKLLPLFRGDVEMDTVTLKGLELNLTRLADGRNNWSDLGGKPGAEAEAPTAEGEQIAALAIGGVDIKNATLHWDDRQAGRKFSLTELNLDTGALELGAPMSLSLSTHVSGNKPPLDGTAELKTTLIMNPFAGQYIAEKLKLKVALQGEELPGGKLDAALAADAAANLIEQTAGLKNLEVSAYSLVASGEVNASNIYKVPEYTGKLKVSEFSPRTLMTLMGIEVPKTADPAVLGKASLQASLSGSEDRLNLKALTAKLDDTTLTGSVAVTNFERPSSRFDLDIDHIDLDRYRSPAAADSGQPQAATPAAAASAAAPLLPVDLLRSLNLAGKARIGTLRIAKIDVTDIQLQANAKSGDVRLAPMTAKLSEGTYEGDIHIDVRGREPVIAVNERMQGVQVAPLIKASTDYDALQGKGNLNARLTTRGNTEAEVRRNLNGNIAFNLGDGLIKGVNIDHLIRAAYATTKGRLPPGDQGVKDTVFSSLQATARVSNGVVQNRDLMIHTDNLRINGEGDIDLANESMKYRLATNVIKSFEGPNSEEFNDLKRLTIPVIIQGPLTNLSYNVDLERLLTEKAKQKVKEKLFDKLLGNDKQPAQQAPEQQEEEKSKEQEAVEQIFKGLFR